jgi:hypothetical protein
VSKPEDADAVLSGALSVSSPSIYGGTSGIGVTVQLRSSTGELLWSGNFAGQIYAGLISSLKFRDVVEYRAKELAKKLSSDREKSAKVAGIKISN